MGSKRRRIEAALKAKAALAAVRGDRTASQLASQFGVHATQIGQWKRLLLQGIAARRRSRRRSSPSCTSRSAGCRWNLPG